MWNSIFFIVFIFLLETFYGNASGSIEQLILSLPSLIFYAKAISDKPKSANFKCPAASSNIFYGFKSLCIIPFLCNDSIANNNSAK